MTDRDIITQLVAIRHQRGLRQRDVATRMSVTTSAVGNFERRSHSPTLVTVLRYADAVGAKIGVEAVTACRSNI